MGPCHPGWTPPATDDGYQEGIPYQIQQRCCRAWRAAPFPAKEGLRVLTSRQEGRVRPDDDETMCPH